MFLLKTSYIRSKELSGRTLLIDESYSQASNV